MKQEYIKHMEAVENETVDLILNQVSRLNAMPRERIKTLYGEWSRENFSAGWMTPTPKGCKAFVKWATIAPCDQPTGYY